MSDRKHNKELPEDGFVRELTAHQRSITGYICSLIPGYADPDDILQEVNILLWAKRAEFQLGTNFKAWAFSVARFKVLEARRQMVKEGRDQVFDEEVIDRLTAEAGNLENEKDGRLAALRRCVGKLSETQSQLLSDCYSGHGAIAAYAEHSGRNAGTIRATLRRIRISLLSCIEKKLENSNPRPLK